ncbi:MAG: hypothetical protein M1825_000851 [Sarcosagium campestre]|nr:MAG: hypothetical protein M1825_000851 [Sarcosagium campestre]
MPDTSKIKEFPEIGNKLSAPSKKSLFERQKAEAEAKRLREQAETAAVYEDFVKSFEDEDSSFPSTGTHTRSDGQTPTPRGGFGGQSKRHFAAPLGAASSKGSSGPRGGLHTSGPGSLGPPSGPGRKRGYDGVPRDSGVGLFAFEDGTSGLIDPKTAFHASDEEESQGQMENREERAPPKPTLHLSSLPPGTSPAVIKSLIPSTLVVDAVRILPPYAPGSTERKSVSAIVTLIKDTPATDIDSAVNGLQNRYVGWGYRLSLSRHLSSAALHAAAPTAVGHTALSSLPFGARPAPTGPMAPMNRAPPPSVHHRGGFAPPISYGNQQGRAAPLMQVSVEPPKDLKQLKLIHRTVEALLTHGPEFEALLMTRPDVQMDERWAWIWDPRSRGGVWYRWRLWEALSGAQTTGRGGRRSNRGMPEYVFDGDAAWVPPKDGLRFEYSTHLDEFVSDSDYNSSEDDDSGDDERRRYNHSRSGPPPLEPGTGLADTDGKAFLNPLRKAKLAHLLSRLPTSNARLRKGDVARITAFAIEHAGEGADEVVDMIVSNIQKPFAFTTANPDRKRDQEQAASRETEPDHEERGGQDKEREDMSSAKLIALYVVSDILSSSSTSGVRHAWRYRQLFEAILRRRQIFETLGRLEKDMQWGRLRAEKWKRSVGNVLTLWEGWCVFPQATQEHFSSVFTNPPPTAAEKAASAAQASAEALAHSSKSKWKTVDVASSKTAEASGPTDFNVPPDIVVPPEDANGEEEDDDIDGEPMEDDDIDGEPMDEDFDGESMSAVGESSGLKGDVLVESGRADGRPRDVEDGMVLDPADDGVDGRMGVTPRRRPRAQDMFADSDDE